MRFLMVVMLLCLMLLVFHAKFSENVDQAIEREFAEAIFTYNYSQHTWCVNAQRRGGTQVGGCWNSLKEAQIGILRQAPAPQK